MLLPDFVISDLSSNSQTDSPFPRFISDPITGSRLIKADKPMISNFVESHLGPTTYDLSLGHKFSSPQKLQAFLIRDGIRFAALPLANTVEIPSNSHDQIEIVVQPGQVFMCHSQEKVTLPPNVAAAVGMRSSFAREWLNHSTALRIHPGFSGNVTFELKNDSAEREFVLRSGQRPIQIEFQMVLFIPQRLYNGVYQNQNAVLESLRTH